MATKRVNRNLKPQHQKPINKVPEDADVGEIFAEADPGPLAPPKSAAKPSAKPAAKGKKKQGAAPTRPLNPQFADRKIHDYEDDPDKKPRKVTKEGKKGLEAWEGAGRGKTRDGYFTTLASEAKKEFGHRSVWVAGDADQLVVGIPLPGLAMEHLFENDVLPMGIVMQLKGKRLTCKTAFLIELYRIFHMCNGMGVHNQVEDKISPDLFSSILGYTPGTQECPVVLNKCSSLDDWERKLSYWVDMQKRRLVGTAEAPGPGRTVPVCFGVDSVMAKSTEEKIEKVTADGFAGRDYPTEALSITGYMRARGGMFDNWPFVLVLINHLKDDINNEGSSRTAGGTFIDHLSTFDIETNLWRKNIDTEDFEGVGVRLKCTKNAMGVTGREIYARMLWHPKIAGYRPWDPVTNRFGVQEYKTLEEAKTAGGGIAPLPVYRQYTYWDWDWATIKLLTELPAKFQKRLVEVGFDKKLEVLKPKGDVDCQVRCRAAGMGKNDWAPWTEVGAKIRQDPVLMDRLRTALLIKRRAVMRGDYLQQLDDLAAKFV